MSEYITELVKRPLDDEFVREEIVRCRDCRFSLAHGNGCARNQDIYDAEPNGFCAWGERRERETVEVWNQWSADDVTCSEKS